MTNRTRRSKAQWQTLVEQQSGSGLKGAAFCRQQGLCRKTFYHHRKLLSEDSNSLMPGRFIQVQAEPTPVLPVIAVLDYRQTCLKIPTGIAPVWVAELMKALS